MPIRKIHTGLPALIIDKLADIVVDDMSDIMIYKGTDADGNPLVDIEAVERWEKIAIEHDFKESIVKEAVKQALVSDAVFKISYDPDVSSFPIIEVFKGRDVDFNYKRGRFIGAEFLSHKLINEKNYFLTETYERNGVKYALYDDNGKDVSVGIIEDLYGLYPFHHSRDLSMAIPLIINESHRFKGRGKSILANKEGSFDSFDEVWSQWMDAIRAGRTTKYIPDELIPRNPLTGELIQPNAYDNQFIGIGTDKSEGANNKITVESPDIRSEKYLSAYVTALDQCLQGIISPSTLGIDVKKLDNAEAQREKEKTTQYTYRKIVGRLEKVIPKLVETVLRVDDLLKKNPDKHYEVSVEFGGYANPSFEAQIETIGKARQQGVMSIERSVEELYGDSLTKGEKAEEVKRLKVEQGYEVEQNSTGDVLTRFDSELDDKADEANESQE